MSVESVGRHYSAELLNNAPTGELVVRGIIKPPFSTGSVLADQSKPGITIEHYFTTSDETVLEVDFDRDAYGEYAKLGYAPNLALGVLTNIANILNDTKPAETN